MIKLTGSVGKMGPNKTCDLALIQAALMNARGGPFWPGPIDGKKTPKLIDAITSFQTAHRVTPANGTIQSFGPTMNRLKSALPMSLSGLGALPDSAVVFVAGAGAREAEREAEETKRKAPFPKLEAEALAKIQKALGKAAGLCLVRREELLKAMDRVQRALLTFDSEVLAAIDDPKDKVAVELGMDLWETFGNGLTLPQLIDAIRTRAGGMATQ